MQQEQSEEESNLSELSNQELGLEGNITSNDIILAIQINIQRGVIGAASYSQNTLSILSYQSCSLDQIDHLVTSLRMSVNPNLVLAHSRTPNSAIDSLVSVL